ncbi:transglycosylase SLT domain-containing protein [Labrys monachus]|uniref:Soluble lytic murein transglycosylase-like protein n=1 Tax=Labrys monachus TaxID=217067 RepID=A0ABU0FPA5_9HYPH|nr:transglycosylase SLT domain-containing protein [Labrys monachus]MDQ0396443.1 soluble lytic murein transglycosylase-like protein [Labrys monachus]
MRSLTAGCLALGLSAACTIGMARDARADDAVPATAQPEAPKGGAKGPVRPKQAVAGEKSAAAAPHAPPLPPARPKELAAAAVVPTLKTPTPAVFASLTGSVAAPQNDVLETGSIPMMPLPSTPSKDGDGPHKQAAGPAGRPQVDALISKHATRYHVPETLLRRIVARESGFNPHLRHGPFVGLMQMRLDTARGMGYRGNPEGLLDPDVNLTYGAAYLANAYKVAGGNQDRAMRLYASGYYYEAKRKGLLPKLIKGSPGQ